MPTAWFQTPEILDGGFAFRQPAGVIEARTLSDVAPALEAAAQAVARGRWAAGFVAYEAAPGLDPALAVRPPGPGPLAWLALFDEAHPAPAPPTPPAPAVEWAAELTPDEYTRRIDDIRAAIARGETYQANFTFRLRAADAGDAAGLWARLRARQPGPYSAWLDAAGFAVASASPELFFERDGDLITCRPMKGTAARGATPEDDARAADALCASEKDRAENIMIVDMVRNDLGRVARTGTVEAARRFEVEAYPTVFQMTSTVTARTRAPLPDLFRALFPAASVTGAPKAATMGLLAGLETSPRGVYTGALGWAAPDGRMRFSVAIRTAWVPRGGAAEYGVGSGILWDSRAGAEWSECLAKAAPLA